MADRVQYILDRMSSVFHQLIQLNLFTEKEVNSIISKRKDFEYLIMRRQLQPSDYSGYIEYETNLFRLVKLRQPHETDDGAAKQQRHVAALMVRHISYVFERAIRRFPSEKHFWMEYVAFLKESQSTTLLSNTLGKAISLHPKDTEFWMLAAMHEIEQNNNIHAARVLLQRGLRVNESSAALWRKYFELELWNAMRIVERQREIVSKAPAAAEVDESPFTVVSVVFKHALTAVPTNDFAFELYDMLMESGAHMPEAVIESCVDTMRSLLGASLPFWSKLITVRLTRALGLSNNDSNSNNNKKNKKSSKRKTGAQSEENVLLACVDGMNLTHILLQQAYDSVGSGSENTQQPRNQFFATACEIVQQLFDGVTRKVDSVVSLPAPAAVTTAKASEASTKGGKRTKRQKSTSGGGDAVAADEESNEATAEGETSKMVLEALKHFQLMQKTLVDWLQEQHHTSVSADTSSSLQNEGMYLMARHSSWCVDHLIAHKQAIRSIISSSTSSASTFATSASSSSSAASIEMVIAWIASTSNEINKQAAAARNRKLSSLSSKQQHDRLVSLIGTFFHGVKTALRTDSWLKQLMASNIHISNVDGAQEDGGEDALSRYRSSEELHKRCEQICEAALSCADAVVSTEVGAEMVWGCIETMHSLSSSSYLWEEALRAVISGRGCPLEQRALWCERYVALAVVSEPATNVSASAAAGAATSDSEDSDSDLDDTTTAPPKSRKAAFQSAAGNPKLVHEWIDCAMVAQPLLFPTAAMSPYYHTVLDALIERIAAEEPSSSSCKGYSSCALKVAEKAVAACPSEGALWDKLEALVKASGDLKALTHVRWRRSKV